MKVILGIAEKLKRQVALSEALSAEKEDLVEKLQVRNNELGMDWTSLICVLLTSSQNAESVKDFLIEKLKTAELAIKSMMSEVSGLKKQAASDSEVSAGSMK